MLGKLRTDIEPEIVLRTPSSIQQSTLTAGINAQDPRIFSSCRFLSRRRRTKRHERRLNVCSSIKGENLRISFESINQISVNSMMYVSGQTGRNMSSVDHARFERPNWNLQARQRRAARNQGHAILAVYHPQRNQDDFASGSPPIPSTSALRVCQRL